MQIHERLKIMRQLKDLTQEELAEKLGYSINGYAKIERGENDVTVGKLEKIAEAMGVSLAKLLGVNDSNVFNVVGNCHYILSQSNVVLTEAQCIRELEKAQLAMLEKDKEINYLKNEVALLKEMLAFLKISEVEQELSSKD